MASLFPLLSPQGWGAMAGMGLSPMPNPHFLVPDAGSSSKATKLDFQQLSKPGHALGLSFKLSSIPGTRD